MSGVSEAFVLAATAIGNVAGVPLPQGLSTARVGDWTLTINNSQAETDDIPPFSVKAINEVYFAFGAFGPHGGMIGGASEEQFIADLKAVVPLEQHP